MQKRISNLLENELAAIYGELGIPTGDIYPEQRLEWDNLTEKMANLFAELIENNSNE